MDKSKIVKGGYYQKGSRIFYVIDIINQLDPDNTLIRYREFDKHGKPKVCNINKLLKTEYLYYFTWGIERRVQPKCLKN